MCPNKIVLRLDLETNDTKNLYLKTKTQELSSDLEIKAKTLE